MEKVKKRLFLLLKLAVSISILFYIYTKVDFIAFLSYFKELSTATIVILILTSLLKHATQCSNWFHALTINPDYKPDLKNIFKSYFIGVALRFVLPGGHATYGKMYFIKNSKKATFISVLIEKFFQTWGNLFFAGVAGIFYFTQHNLLLRLSIASIIAISPLILLIIVYLIPKYREYTSSLKKIFPKIMFSQLFFIPLTMIQYWLILKSFTQITLFQTSISTALILSANVIPVTFAGLGLREFFAINVLDKYNITETAAVTTALIIFIINTLLPALVGLYFIIMHKKKH